jgi:hypothetical protein
MAQPEFMMSPSVAVAGRKPKTSIYTVLLVIALIALLIGCLTMWLEIKQLEGSFGADKRKVSANFLPSATLIAMDAANRAASI